MGLGKTIQTISAIKSIYEEIGVFRCLIIVPNSLLYNWISEFNIWFNEISPTLLIGDKKTDMFNLICLQASFGNI